VICHARLGGLHHRYDRAARDPPISTGVHLVERVSDLRSLIRSSWLLLSIRAHRLNPSRVGKLPSGSPSRCSLNFGELQPAKALRLKNGHPGNSWCSVNTLPNQTGYL
jgi:hypothetical protein